MGWLLLFLLLLLFVGVAWLIYKLVIDLPRETYRYLCWALDPRRRGALPGTRAFAKRAVHAEALLVTASALPLSRIHALPPDEAADELAVGVQRAIGRAPASARNALRAFEKRAYDLLLDRAEHEDLAALAPDPGGYNLWLADPSWKAVLRALEAAGAATMLGEALGEATRTRWLAVWKVVTNQ
jgi:hypothetical protein